MCLPSLAGKMLSLRRHCTDMILIAPDKFKGSLTARQVCRIVGEALHARGLTDTLSLPMADGGEGTPGVLGGRRVIVSHDFIGTANPAMRGGDVMHRSSAPLGRAIIAAERRQPGRPLYIGIGGTATSDGGAGLLQALGVRYFDRSGREMTVDIAPAHLPQIARADLSRLDRAKWSRLLTGLSDVKASLLPPGLSTLSFAVQKGARVADIPLLEAGLANLREALGVNVTSPYDGAGGGVGFALASVIGAGVMAGARAILDSYTIDWDRVELVITGEGRIDSQTAGGKVVDTLCRRARDLGVPSLAIGGYAEPRLRAGGRHTVLSTIPEPGDYDAALAAPRLRAAVERYLDMQAAHGG